jgi:diguanylate cyclase (GGDEF)-like protein/PAS domain S-box-containing protein
MNRPAQILILEDVATDAELVQRELRRADMAFSARQVDSKDAFLLALTEFEPDIVLSDYSLPQFSGLEAVRLLKERGLVVPFILVTGSMTEEKAVECMKEGVDDYILKTSLKRLPSAVQNALEKKEAERDKARVVAALRESEERFQLVARATNDAIWDWNISANTVWWSEGVRTLFGYEQGGMHVEPSWWHERIHADDNERVSSSVKTFIEGEAKFWSDEYRYRRADGSYAAVIDRAFILRDEEGKALRMIGSMMDITARRQAEERINYLAYYDALTGLANRALFEDRLPQALSLAQRNEQILAVMLLDLDRFKNINDTLGHGTGDLLLKAVAERLSSCLRGSDTVARFAGDGFALLLTQIRKKEDAARIAKRTEKNALEIAQNILEALKAPFSFDGHELYVTASIGISLYPHDGGDPPALLKNAGAALHAVKEQGGNGYQFYAESMNARAVEQLTLESALRRALEREEFALHYQPQVDINTGKILAVEALIRWQSPDLGFVSPGDFIPLAENNGLIVPIGEWTLRTACAQNRAWQDEGLSPLRMSVNLSPRQFEQANLLETVASVLDESGLDPNYLEFELTEGAIMKNAERAIVTLRKLKEMQIQIAIDDFGSGYSSLSYLKRFPIDRLKIDQSFVRDATSDPTNAAIIMAIITLGQNLRLKVIAEGVETEEQLKFLRLLRCDEMQGWLFSKAVPAQYVKQLIQRSHLTPSESAISRLAKPLISIVDNRVLN